MATSTPSSGSRAAVINNDDRTHELQCRSVCKAAEQQRCSRDAGGMPAVWLVWCNNWLLMQHQQSRSCAGPGRGWSCAQGHPHHFLPSSPHALPAPPIQVANRQFSTHRASNHFHRQSCSPACQKPPAPHTLTGFPSLPCTSNLALHRKQHSTGQQHLACPSCCWSCSAQDQISHLKAAQQLIAALRPSQALWSGSWGW